MRLWATNGGGGFTGTPPLPTGAKFNRQILGTPKNSQENGNCGQKLHISANLGPKGGQGTHQYLPLAQRGKIQPTNIRHTKKCPKSTNSARKWYVSAILGRAQPRNIRHTKKCPKSANSARKLHIGATLGPKGGQGTHQYPPPVPTGAKFDQRALDTRKNAQKAQGTPKNAQKAQSLHGSSV